MLFRILCFVAVVILTGCNTIAIKPHSLDIKQKIYVDTNGEKMRMAVKGELENRGYDVTVGKKLHVNNVNYSYNEHDSVISTTSTDGAGYIATIYEYPVGGSLRVLGRFPLCAFNGWAWWDFSVSIADNQTGQEILNWSGMGCKGIVQDQLKELLDELEK